MAQENAEKTRKLELSGDYTVDNSEELKNRLCSALNELDRLKLDMSGITNLDLTFVQVLCSMFKTTANANRIEVEEQDLGLLAEMADKLGMYYSCVQCNVPYCIVKEVITDE